MDMVVARYRMNLRFAPETPKSTGKDNAVVILMKRATSELFAAMSRFTKSFASQQCVPVQGLSPYCHYRAGAKLS